MNIPIPVSEYGKRWMTLCLDPFHDDVVDCEGLPDMRSCQSVTVVHNQSLNLTVPTSAGAGLWDAQITLTGFNSSLDAVAPNMSYVEQVGPQATACLYNSAVLVPANAARFGALVVQEKAAGSNFNYHGLVVGDFQFCLGNFRGEQPCRVIAQAVEVHNTTAEVYKQGTVACAMMPDPIVDHNDVQYIDSTGTWQPAGIQGSFTPKYPHNLATLQQVPTCGTWEAEKGIYAIPRMTNPQVALTSGLQHRTVVVRHSADANYGVLLPSAGVADGAGGGTWPVVLGHMESGFSPLVIHFSGLSNETTLRLVYRSVVEYFPEVGDPLLPTASPSAHFDPVALAVYSATIANAPYAVPVGMNPKGEYFKKIMDMIYKVAPVVAPFLGPYSTISRGIGMAAGGMSKAYELIARRSKKQDTKVRRNEAGMMASVTRKPDSVAMQQLALQGRRLNVQRPQPRKSTGKAPQGQPLKLTILRGGKLLR